MMLGSKYRGENKVTKTTHFFVSFVCISSFLVYYFLFSPLRAGYYENQFSDGSGQYIQVIDFNEVSDFQLQPIPFSKNISRTDFNPWLKDQERVSFERMFDNICNEESSGKFDNCFPGVVFASPSKSKPDYFYHWIRDGAITINTLINTYSEVDKERTLKTVLNYVNASIDLQHRSNPSGPVDDPLLRNLGEPKYHVDNSPFEQVWGRPQNDGPPLRAIALLNFLNSMNVSSSSDANSDYQWIFDDLITLDLKFVLYNWHVSSFDLWEEVDAYHFFTSMVQLKALVDGRAFIMKKLSSGITLTSAEDDLLKDLEAGIAKVESFIKSSSSGFINHEKGYIVETPSNLDQRSGLDIAVIMASTLTHDSEDENDGYFTNYDQFSFLSAAPGPSSSSFTSADKTDTPFLFDIDDPLILNHFNELVEKMAILYPINHNRLGTNMGVAVGRYPEDIYDGIGISEGNPWFISTLTSAELIFKLVHKMHITQEPLIIEPLKNKFWHKIFAFGNLQNTSVMIPYNSLAFNQTLYTIFKYGDSFLSKVNEHVSDQGHMSEQFNRYHGYNQGAENLTWSYGTFANALRWRQIVDNLIHPTNI